VLCTHNILCKNALRLKIFAHLLNNADLKRFYDILIELQKWRCSNETNDPRHDRFWTIFLTTCANCVTSFFAFHIHKKCSLLFANMYITFYSKIYIFNTLRYMKAANLAGKMMAVLFFLGNYC
jgi:hypothetical protein